MKEENLNTLDINMYLYHSGIISKSQVNSNENLDFESLRSINKLQNIASKNHHIQRAIDDYYKVFQQQSKYLKEDFEEYEDKLVDEWERYKDHLEDENINVFDIEVIPTKVYWHPKFVKRVIELLKLR